MVGRWLREKEREREREKERERERERESAGNGNEKTRRGREKSVRRFTFSCARLLTGDRTNRNKTFALL